MAKMGRPTIYSQEIATKICNRIMRGESIRSICKDDGYPETSTVFYWLADVESNKVTHFLEQYEKAREIQAETLADELTDIADDGTNDYMERLDKEGKGDPGWVYNGEHVQRSRLRVDVRKWIASKLKPKKYGDKMDLTTNGESLNVQVLPSSGHTPVKPKEDNEK